MARLPFRHMTKETRLLAATLVVSVLVLFLLARFRYPAPESAGSAATQPLARLAAAVAYDELASTIGQLESRVSPSLLVIRIAPAGTREALEPRERLEPFVQSGPVIASVGLVPALRVRDDRAIAVLPAGARIQGMVGSREVPSVVSRDPVRGVALLKVPTQPAPVISVWDGRTPLGTPRYIAVAEGTRGGPTLRPLFIGRADAMHDPRWDASVLALGGTSDAHLGTFAFALDGRLVGLMAHVESGPALVPADTLMQVSDQLARDAPRSSGELGLTTHALTPSLAMAADAQFGVMVAFVDPTGPTANAISVGDVIWAINGELVYSAEEFRTRVARMPPGTPARLSVVRGGEKVDVEAVVREQDDRPSLDAPAGLGLVLREVDGLGAEVMRVLPRGAAASAGIAPGDLIIHLGGADAPSPGTVARIYRETASGGVLLVGVQRDGAHQVLALAKP